MDLSVNAQYSTLISHIWIGDYSTKLLF